jgi:hypothetical protein
MKPLLLALLGVATSFSVHAEEVRCKVRYDINDTHTPTLVAWDTTTKQALVEVPWNPDQQASGQLILSRRDGTTVNLLFKGIDDGAEEFEFLVFKIYQGEYRLITAGYKYVNGVRYLTSNFGSHWADCTSTAGQN